MIQDSISKPGYRAKKMTPYVTSFNTQMTVPAYTQRKHVTVKSLHQSLLSVFSAFVKVRFLFHKWMINSLLCRARASTSHILRWFEILSSVWEEKMCPTIIMLIRLESYGAEIKSQSRNQRFFTDDGVNGSFLIVPFVTWLLHGQSKNTQQVPQPKRATPPPQMAHVTWPEIFEDLPRILFSSHWRDARHW